MSFFSTLYNSLYNFKWLRDQKNNKSWAWGYFLLLMILVAGLTSISLGFKYYDSIPSVKNNLYKELPEFQAEVKNGQLEVSGIYQPYIKDYSSLAVVVDTNATNTLDIKSFAKQEKQSVLLVTKNNFEMYNGIDKTIKTQAIKDFDNFKTDRNEILKKAEVFFSGKMVVIFTVASLIILFVALTVKTLLNILVFSFLFYTIAKQQKTNWKFKEVFTVGLFAVTLPLILTQTAPGIYSSWSFVLLFSGWMYIVVLKKEKV